MHDARTALVDSLDTFAHETIEQQPQQVTKKLEMFKAEEEKVTIEDSVRAHLRGFACTIPSFLMAYGDRDLTLANIDDYTEDDVFAEVTGITEEQFRFLRDGGDYIDEATGKTERFAGEHFGSAPLASDKPVAKPSQEAKPQPSPSAAAQKPMPSKPVAAKPTESKPKETGKKKSVLDELDAAGLSYFDKRPKDGLLWVIGGKEIEPLLKSLKPYGVKFKFKPQGGKATKGRPAWWSK